MASLSYQRRMAKGNIDSYNRSGYHDIYEAYDRPSSNKVSAWKYCQNKCSSYNGRGLKIISRNTYTFTAGFEFDNPETGELMFMFITPSYDVAVPLT